MRFLGTAGINFAQTHQAVHLPSTLDTGGVFSGQNGREGGVDDEGTRQG